MAADPHWSSVSFLARMVSGWAGYSDLSPQKNVVSLVNGATIVADADFIGGYALNCGGSGACAETPGTAALALGSGDFCVEFDIETTDTTGGAIDFFQSGIASSWQVYVEGGKVAWYAGTTRVVLGATSINTGVKRRIAVARASGTMRLFVDGALDASAANVTNYSSVTAKLSIGRQAVGSPSATSDLIAKINEVRITKGVARYTAAYTPSTEPFPNGGAEISGTVTEDGAAASRVVRAYDRTTGSFLSETSSNISTGAYTIYVPAAGEYQVVVLDDAASPVQNDLIGRAMAA